MQVIQYGPIIVDAGFVSCVQSSASSQLNQPLGGFSLPYIHLTNKVGV